VLQAASSSWSAEDLPLLRELANRRVFSHEVVFEALKAMAKFSKKEAMLLMSELANDGLDPFSKLKSDVYFEALKALTSFSKRGPATAARTR
jgi:hypothetical protein